MSERARRQAVNEALMREVNEHLAERDRSARADEDDLFAFVCECSIPLCDQHIRMTLREYDVVREQDDRFAGVPGHEAGSIERVVVTTDRFSVVDKTAAVEAYVADDPRGAPSG